MIALDVYEIVFVKAKKNANTGMNYAILIVQKNKLIAAVKTKEVHFSDGTYVPVLNIYILLFCSCNCSSLQDFFNGLFSYF